MRLRLDDCADAAIALKEKPLKTVKAAAVQLSPVLYSREGTVNKIVRTIHDLRRGGAVRHVSGNRGPLLPLLFVHPVGVSGHCRR